MKVLMLLVVSAAFLGTTRHGETKWLALAAALSATTLYYLGYT